MDRAHRTGIYDLLTATGDCVSISLFLKNFRNPQPPTASAASFHKDERVFEA